MHIQIFSHIFQRNVSRLSLSSVYTNVPGSRHEPLYNSERRAFEIQNKEPDGLKVLLIWISHLVFTDTFLRCWRIVTAKRHKRKGKQSVPKNEKFRCFRCLFKEHLWRGCSVTGFIASRRLHWKPSLLLSPLCRKNGSTQSNFGRIKDPTPKQSATGASEENAASNPSSRL